MKRNFLFIIVVVLLGSGCQKSFFYSGTYGLNFVQPGSKITVTQTLKSENGTRLYLQRGRVTHSRDVDQNQPYCQFYLDRARTEFNNEIEIKADSFLIENIYHRREIVGITSTNIARAELNTASTIIIPGSNQLGSEYTLATYFDIYSANQPIITQLICSVWAVSNERDYVTLEEIESLLGDLVAIVGPNQ